MSGELGYGIVRSDIAGNSTDEQVEALRDLACDLGMRLIAIAVLPDDTHYAVLLATLEPSNITTVLVPTTATLDGWLHAFRMDVNVLTATPRYQWPRRSSGASSMTAE